MSAKLKVKRGTTTGWENAEKNTLESGQLGIEYREGKAPRVKVGPNSETPTHWDAITSYLAPDASVYQDSGIYPEWGSSSDFTVGAESHNLMIQGSNIDLRTDPLNSESSLLLDSQHTSILGSTVGIDSTDTLSLNGQSSVEVTTQNFLVPHVNITTGTGTFIPALTADINNNTLHVGYEYALTNLYGSSIYVSTDDPGEVILSTPTIDAQNSNLYAKSIKIIDHQALAYDDMNSCLDIGDPTGNGGLDVTLHADNVITLSSTSVKSNGTIFTESAANSLGTSEHPWSGIYGQMLEAVMIQPTVSTGSALGGTLGTSSAVWNNAYISTLNYINQINPMASGTSYIGTPGMQFHTTYSKNFTTECDIPISPTVTTSMSFSIGSGQTGPDNSRGLIFKVNNTDAAYLSMGRQNGPESFGPSQFFSFGGWSSGNNLIWSDSYIGLANTFGAVRLAHGGSPDKNAFYPTNSSIDLGKPDEGYHFKNIYTNAVTKTHDQVITTNYNVSPSAQLSSADIQKFIISTDVDTSNYAYDSSESGQMRYSGSDLLLMASCQYHSIPPTSQNSSCYYYKYKRGLGIFSYGYQTSIQGVTSSQTISVTPSGEVTTGNETISLDSYSISFGTSSNPLYSCYFVQGDFVTGYFRSLYVKSKNTSGTEINKKIPAIHIGIGVPSDSLGNNDDIYIQYIA